MRGVGMDIAVVVETREALPDGARLWLAGNTEQLGRWRPDGLAMVRTGDCGWEATVRVGDGEPVEFKVTRGGWDTEARMEGCGAGNLRLLAEEGSGVVRRWKVASWKDERKKERRIAGEYEVWEKWPSAWLGREREVIVWLPPGYRKDRAEGYPVLYLQDGRQVFDPGTSTWGAAWEVDETGQQMVETGGIEPFIAVAADCTEAREEEYAPTKRGDDYLRFLTQELKPEVDRRFRTDPARNYIGGSSMGGLISFYAGWTRPDVFAGAACLSPAFCGEYAGPMARAVEGSAAAGRMPGTRFFLSCGSGDDLERLLLDGTLEMAGRLEKLGYPRERVEVRIAPGEPHNEAAWAKMTPHFLRWFFGR